MSVSPAARAAIWVREFATGVISTAMPSRATRPVLSATQSGRLKPPGKTLTLRRSWATVRSGTRTTNTETAISSRYSMEAPSDVEEHRLALTLEDKVEAIGVRAF